MTKVTMTVVETKQGFFRGSLYITYPECMVVLCTDDNDGDRPSFTGTVVYEGRSNYDCGYYMTSWDKAEFEPFKGTITMEGI